MILTDPFLIVVIPLFKKVNFILILDDNGINVLMFSVGYRYLQKTI